MKKRLILIWIAVLMLLIPHVASANSPSRNPWMIEVNCTHMKPGVRVDAVLLRKDGTTRTEENVFYPSYQSTAEGDIRILFEDGETSFYLKHFQLNGTEICTETVPLVRYGRYAYDGSTYTLKADGTYYSEQENCRSSARILFLLLAAFLLPLALTLLIECLTARCFQLYTVKYVVVINLITNPVMNILLLFLTVHLWGSVGYWIVLALLELAVIAAEYFFYRAKYRSATSAQLLVFTITANVLSCLLGILVQRFF